MASEISYSAYSESDSETELEAIKLIQQQVQQISYLKS